MMILLCLGCAVLAVLWAVPAPTSRRRRDRLERAAVTGRPAPRPGRGRFVLLVAAGSGAVLLIGILVDGARGGCLA